MQVEIWSDVVCPWCYIGKRRFERALAAFPHAGEVEVLWRSFELDPDAPAHEPGRPPVDLVATLGAKYGGGRERVLQMIGHVSQVAAEEGLEYDLEHARGGTTRPAHRLLHAALHEGGPALQSALKERLMRAYFTQRLHVADPAVLVRLAGEAGLDETVAREVLAGDAYGTEVDADVALARSFGATGVPFFVVDRRYGISGAQPLEVFTRTLEQAWAEHRPLQVVGAAGTSAGAGAAGASQRSDDPACGPDGCAI